MYSNIVKMTQFFILRSIFFFKADVVLWFFRYGNCVLITGPRTRRDKKLQTSLAWVAQRRLEKSVEVSFDMTEKNEPTIFMTIFKWPGEKIKKPRGESLKPWKLDYEKQLNNFYVVKHRMRKVLYLVFDFSGFLNEEQVLCDKEVWLIVLLDSEL